MAEGSLFRCINVPAPTLLSLLKVWVDLRYGTSMGTGNVEAQLLCFASASFASKETDFLRVGEDLEALLTVICQWLKLVLKAV